MAPSKLRRAIGAVKDQTSIGIAKVSNSNSISDIDVAIVKATRHDELPAEERHIREIISLTCYSRVRISACVTTLARRLNKTKNWIVALKTLVLIQRLLGEGDPEYEQEIFFATRRGTRLLNMSDFRDTSHSHSWDYSAFVRTYALYLDEQLEHRMQGQRGKRGVFRLEEEEEEHEETTRGATPVRQMKTEEIFIKMQHLQQLLERFLACKPTGGAKNNRVVFVALYPIVKESFQIYQDITEILSILVDRFPDMEVPDCVKVYEIFYGVKKQFDELEAFYEWCKDVGVARSSEYPDIERITQKKLDLMDEFILEKSAEAQSRRARNMELRNASTPEPEAVEEEEQDMNSIKALPPPEGLSEPAVEEEEEKKAGVQQQEADLLDLGDAQEVSSEEYEDKLKLALFDGGMPSKGSTSPAPSWTAFTEETTDWETALMQSASGLSNQKATLGGGFDMLLFNGMYQQGATAAAKASATYMGYGSASSVAAWATDRTPTMLALPAPSVQDARTRSYSMDPFAASLAVAPPPYVQMSDMEQKQKLLMEEKLMWQQYTRDGMQGHYGMAKLQANPYNLGGYPRSYSGF